MGKKWQLGLNDSLTINVGREKIPNLPSTSISGDRKMLQNNGGTCTKQRERYKVTTKITQINLMNTNYSGLFTRLFITGELASAQKEPSTSCFKPWITSPRYGDIASTIADMRTTMAKANIFGG